MSIVAVLFNKVDPLDVDEALTIPTANGAEVHHKLAVRRLRRSSDQFPLARERHRLIKNSRQGDPFHLELYLPFACAMLEDKTTHVFAILIDLLKTNNGRSARSREATMGNRALWPSPCRLYGASEVRPSSCRGFYYDIGRRPAAIADFPELLWAEIDRCNPAASPAKVHGVQRSISVHRSSGNSAIAASRLRTPHRTPMKQNGRTSDAP